MKKIFIGFLFLLLCSFQGIVQDAASFKIYTLPSRFDSGSLEVFQKIGFVTTDIFIMTQGQIVYADDPAQMDAKRVKRALVSYFPQANSQGMLVLDWEAGPYKALLNYPPTDSHFKDAEEQFLDLLKEVKRHRANLKVAFYGLPFRTYYGWQKSKYNGQNKFDNILSQVDFICPSLYLMKPDEEIGQERNYQYLRDNLDPALYYGKKYNKPVIPFLTHRVHFSNKQYSRAILQKEVFAKYVKYVAHYSRDKNKAAGIFWWDDLRGRLKNLEGINNHLKGKVTDKASYDEMIVEYGQTLKKSLAF